MTLNPDNDPEFTRLIATRPLSEFEQELLAEQKERTRIDKRQGRIAIAMIVAGLAFVMLMVWAPWRDGYTCTTKTFRGDTTATGQVITTETECS